VIAMNGFVAELIGGPFDGHMGKLAGAVSAGMTAIFFDVAADGDRWAYALEDGTAREWMNGLPVYKFKVLCQVASEDAKKGGAA
jgi:hypothetical protein